MPPTITLFNKDNTTGAKTILGQLGLDPEDAAVFSRWLSTRTGYHGTAEIRCKEMHRMLNTHQACSCAASELALYILQWQTEVIHALSAGHTGQVCVSDYPDRKAAKGQSVMFAVSDLPDSS